MLKMIGLPSQLILLTYTCLVFSSNSSVASSFDHWKNNYIKKMEKAGFSQKFLVSIFSDLKFDKDIVFKQANQVHLDKDRDFDKFLKKWMKEEPTRLEKASEVLNKNLKLLIQVEKKFQVEKEIIVAVWGVETFFGEITGDHDLIQALASLAYKGRRKAFFSTQLQAALWLLYKKYITRNKLKGSWAGATGQCQFMPSNIPVMGYDFNGDKRIDIWTDKGDIFASIANYLKVHGWRKGYSVGTLALSKRNVVLKENVFRKKSNYKKLGFRKWNGADLDGNWLVRRLHKIHMKNAPVILRGSNYLPLLRWNKSNLFIGLNIIIFEHLMKNKQRS